MNDTDQLIDINTIIGELNISASFIGLVARSLKKYKLDVNEVFKDLGLPVPTVNNPIERSSLDQFTRLIDYITAISNDPCIGVKIFASVKTADLSALGFSISCSTTLLGVAERLQRFMPYLISTGHFDIIDDDANSLIVIESPESSELHRVLECFYAGIVAICREITGKDTIFQNMFIAHDAHPLVQSYLEGFSQCPVNINSPFNGFRISNKMLSEKLPSANPEMARLNDILLTEQLNKIYKSNIIFRVEQLILEGLENGNFGKAEIASQLAMCERTLHQRLEERGVVFGDIVTRIRKNLAMQYIKANELRINQIAYKLGFASASNFSRSFKHWTGCTPKEFKEL